jgi:hypothetical protein
MEGERLSIIPLPRRTAQRLCIVSIELLHSFFNSRPPPAPRYSGA